MRLVMMATGPFALPAFRSLVKSRHELAALVTRPTPPGARKPPPQPMREAAEQAGIPVLTPEDVNAEAARRDLAARSPELFVVCDYGQILSAETLAVAPLGGVNLHGSLLPKYRGAAPIHWAIYHGERETGVTVIHMTPRVDAGPRLSWRSTPIDPNETAVELERRLAELGVAPLHEAIEMLERWDGRSPLGQPQDPAQATRAPRLRKSHGRVDWRRSAEQIRNQVRAMKPWPGTYTAWPRSGRPPLRLILDWVDTADPERPPEARPGQVVRADQGGLWVAAGQGIVAIERIQPAGKRVMDAAAFLRGYRVAPGDQFES